MPIQKSLKFIKYFVGILLISVLIILLSYTGALSLAEGLLGKFTYPIVSFVNGFSLKTKGIGESIKDLRNLQNENKSLKDDIKELTLEISKLKEAKEENESLKKQLGFVKSVTYQTLAASVVTKDPSSFLRVVIINRGSKDGIKKNMPVISDGFLVGKIQEVNPDSSKVLLLSDSSFEVSGIIQGSKALGIIKGQIGSGIAMEMIPKDQTIKNGDTVVTSNLETDVPEGLLVGKINEISTESSGLFQKASITPFVNINDIRNVIIITSLK
ncbi:rod shape-determining protein MreC [bacterium CG2_30_33_46]|nr:MAG: rod shape-determining protein MreC [bacterium CG2_30_33_46]